MIKIENLICGYNHIPLHSPLSINIANGKWCLISGANGTGKTTLIKTILDIIKPISGSVNINTLKQKISYMPQEHNVDNHALISGMELINMSFRPWKVFSRPDISKLKQLCKIFNVNYASQILTTLSGGQKKRIYLIQSLVNSPELLILDEPFANLDIHSQNELINTLRNIYLESNFSLIIISHQREFIMDYIDETIELKPHGSSDILQ